MGSSCGGTWVVNKSAMWRLSCCVVQHHTQHQQATRVNRGVARAAKWRCACSAQRGSTTARHLTDRNTTKHHQLLPCKHTDTRGTAWLVLLTNCCLLQATVFSSLTPARYTHTCAPVSVHISHSSHPYILVTHFIPPHHTFTSHTTERRSASPASTACGDWTTTNASTRSCMQTLRQATQKRLVVCFRCSGWLAGWLAVVTHN